MTILVSYLTKKQRGGVARRDMEVAPGELRLGRGADCEVHLADPRVLLHHATISPRGGGWFVEAQGPAELRVNGAVTGASSLRLGDKLSLGPYDLQVAEAPGYDFAITVELAAPLGDDLEQLKQRSGVKLTSAGLGKRAWSWTLAIVVLGIFLALPLAGFFSKTDAGQQNFMAGAERTWLTASDIVWISGNMAGPHKFFGDSCEACHQKPFVMVQDQACLACHAGIENHADPARFDFASFSGQLCQSCHKEHNANLGKAALISQEQRFCADCHSGLKERAPATELVNVTNFSPGAHPEFRVSVMGAGAKVVRAPLDGSPKPQEVSGLKFPHDKHMKKEGIRNPEKGMVKLECATCHAPAPGGIGLLPVRMESHCAECHSLRFEPKALDRVLPHAKPEQALLVMRDFYAGQALRGEVTDETAPALVRRRPGIPFTEPERLEALAWAERKSLEVGDQVFGKTLCASCHTVAGGQGKWEVAKVSLTWHWMPKAKLFPHNRHEPMACVACHDAEQSASAADVLMPSIKTCQQCHGGETAADKVPSTCISCHEFHLPHLAPMREQSGRSAMAK